SSANSSPRHQLDSIHFSNGVTLIVFLQLPPDNTWVYALVRDFPAGIYSSARILVMGIKSPCNHQISQTERTPPDHCAMYQRILIALTSFCIWFHPWKTSCLLGRRSAAGE